MGSAALATWEMSMIAKSVPSAMSASPPLTVIPIADPAVSISYRGLSVVKLPGAAPSKDWLFRLGASPSGSSWSFNPDGSDASLNLDAWDFGLSAERRLSGGLWLSLEAGVGGFRGLRLSGSDVESPDLDVSTSPYLGINLNFRPAIDF